MNEIFEKIYNDNNTSLNEDIALFEKVYTEAEMLNEMNPKLRALLAAGLIGTASLGAASCSMPTDDPTGYEQPAPENPEEIEDSEEIGDFEAPENPEDSENSVTFETLGVTPGHAESLARAIKKGTKDQLRDFDRWEDLIYKNKSFVKIDFDSEADYIDADGQYDDGQTYILYVDTVDKKIFYVPVDMESDFDAAIAAYNNAQ